MTHVSPTPRPLHKRERRYLIRDASGAHVATHVRLDRPEGKEMPWELPDGTKGLSDRPVDSLPLYGSEEVSLWPKDCGEPIFVTEGEKDMEALSQLGFCALGTVCSATNTPTLEAVQPIAEGRGFILWPDHDDVGRAHMARLAQVLYRAEASWVHVIDTSTLPWRKGAGAADFARPIPSPADPERAYRDIERVQSFASKYARAVSPRSEVATRAPLRLVVSAGRDKDQLDAETLRGRLERVKPLTTGGYKARCPAHEDKVASLSFRDGDDGKLLLRCHAGCSFEAVMESLA